MSKTQAAKDANQRYAVRNKEQLKANNLKYRLAHPELCLLRAAKARAKKRGLEFALTETDVVIPEYCPILKFKLERKQGSFGGQDTSPSIDRINPAKGYVPGNVWVISQKANAMKSNATEEELQQFAWWIETYYG